MRTIFEVDKFRSELLDNLWGHVLTSWSVAGCGVGTETNKKPGYHV